VAEIQFSILLRPSSEVLLHVRKIIAVFDGLYTNLRRFGCSNEGVSLRTKQFLWARALIVEVVVENGLFFRIYIV
jgi:hypothetical protein